MCGIFEFSDFAQKMWKKIRFKFENSEKIYKGFPCKKKNPREFFVKWTQIKIKGSDDDDDDDPKMFFKSAKTRVFCNWWIIFSCYLIKKIIDKISMGELCS